MKKLLILGDSIACDFPFTSIKEYKIVNKGVCGYETIDTFKQIYELDLEDYVAVFFVSE